MAGYMHVTCRVWRHPISSSTSFLDQELLGYNVEEVQGLNGLIGSFTTSAMISILTSSRVSRKRCDDLNSSLHRDTSNSQKQRRTMLKEHWCSRYITKGVRHYLSYLYKRHSLSNKTKNARVYYYQQFIYNENE